MNYKSKPKDIHSTNLNIHQSNYKYPPPQYQVRTNSESCLPKSKPLSKLIAF